MDYHILGSPAETYKYVYMYYKLFSSKFQAGTAFITNPAYILDFPAVPEYQRVLILVPVAQLDRALASVLPGIFDKSCVAKNLMLKCSRATTRIKLCRQIIRIVGICY